MTIHWYTGKQKDLICYKFIEIKACCSGTLFRNTVYTNKRSSTLEVYANKLNHISNPMTLNLPS